MNYSFPAAGETQQLLYKSDEQWRQRILAGWFLMSSLSFALAAGSVRSTRIPTDGHVSSTV